MEDCTSQWSYMQAAPWGVAEEYGHMESYLENNNYNDWEGVNYNYSFYENPNCSYSRVDNPYWADHSTYSWEPEYGNESFFNFTSPIECQATQQQELPQPKTLSLEDMFMHFMEKQQAYSTLFDSSIKNIEVHLRQIAQVVIDGPNEALVEVTNPKFEEDESEEQFHTISYEVEEGNKIEEAETKQKEEQPPINDEPLHFTMQIIKDQTREDNALAIKLVVNNISSESFFLEETKCWSTKNDVSPINQQTRKILAVHPLLQRMKTGWLGQRNVGKIFQCNPG